MKHNGHVTFESITDSWNMRSDENINSGTILSFDAVCMHWFTSHNNVKEKIGILSSIRDHRKNNNGDCLHLQIY